MGLNEKIAFIGGGRMGAALIKGILNAQLLDADKIIVAEPDEARQTYLSTTFGVAVHPRNETVLEQCGIVILAVKPQIMAQVLAGISHQVRDKQLLISIAAGITIDFIVKHLGRECRAVRVMPNTPALVLEGVSALCRGSRASQQDLDTAVAIFKAVGRTVLVAEKDLDAVTGLSGSGPAYVFSFIEALIEAGVEQGLNRPVAETLVMQTVLGAARLAMSGNDSPAELIRMVTSPGGTTLAGLEKLQSAGFKKIIIEAVAAATRRSRELGQ